MLFNYEMKKIWRRVSPLSVLIILLVTCVLTITLTSCFSNKALPSAETDISVKYAALETKIKDWDSTINRNEFATAFDEFYSSYKVMNASTLNGENLVTNYKQAGQKFQTFYTKYQYHICNGSQNKITDYLLVQSKYAKDFNQILEILDSFFIANYEDKTDIIKGLEITNPAWEDANLQTVLYDLFYIQTISEADLTELKDFFTAHPANEDRDYSIAYEYALNRYWLAIASTTDYTGDLSQYEGFTEYKDVATSTAICKLADYRLQHADVDFTEPFSFGKILMPNGQVSLFDFVFTNLEMAMFFLIFLAMIWTATVFFTDKYQSTLITPITAGKKRSTIVITKTAVVIVLVAVTLLILTGVYLTCGLLMFNACISPDILFLLNGTTPTVMSAANYFALYFLSLIFKLLTLIAVCGLFSFIKTKPFVIIGLTSLVYIAFIISNLCLGHFSFYQYIPLMGLDPIRYCGAELLFMPMPSAYNFWYTVPVMLVITILLYWILIRKFSKHDFY